MCRQKNHQKAEDADEIVVVQVSGLIHQFDVGEAEEKDYDGNAVFVSDCHKEGRQSADCKNQIGPFAKRLYPFKAVVRKEKLWFNVELGYPSVDRKTNDAPQHQNSE